MSINNLDRWPLPASTRQHRGMSTPAIRLPAGAQATVSLTERNLKANPGGGMLSELNYLTHEGAAELTHRLRDYWRQRGHEIRVHVAQVSLGQRGAVWCVRTNLVRGLPLRPNNKSEIVGNNGKSVGERAPRRPRLVAAALTDMHRD